MYTPRHRPISARTNFTQTQQLSADAFLCVIRYVLRTIRMVIRSALRVENKFILSQKVLLFSTILFFFQQGREIYSIILFAKIMHNRFLLWFSEVSHWGEGAYFLKEFCTQNQNQKPKLRNNFIFILINKLILYQCLIPWNPVFSLYYIWANIPKICMLSTC